MRGNLHKSESGWVRLRARVNDKQPVRAAIMDHRPDGRKIEEAKLKEKPRKRVSAVEQVQVDEDGNPVITRNGRKRRRAFVAHNGRY